MVRIKINNNYYTIRFAVSIDELKNKEGTVCKGIIRYSSKLILLDKHLSYEDMYRVLKHELAHGYLYETQICLWEKKLFSEEDICEFMALYGDKIIRQAKTILNKLWGTRNEEYTT